MHRIPQAFLSYKQFILVKIIPNPKGGKPLKIPCDRHGNKHDAHDPAIWLSPLDAVTIATNTGFHIGFVFTENDPFFFVDVDSCLIEGAWSPLAIDVFNRFPGAAFEVSISGIGMHIFGTAQAIDHNHKCQSAYSTN